jgi:raffinose/stachyose/melibiose transport system substrate-binding protein
MQAHSIRCPRALKLADAGNLIDNYNYDPDDHYSKVGAEMMQQYLAGKIDRAKLAEMVEQYWSTVTPVEH